MGNDETADAASEQKMGQAANSEAIGKPEPLMDVDDALALAIEGAVGRAAAPLLRAIEDRLALDRFRETQIDKLHMELQTYKADLVSKAIQPVLKSLIRLHDDMGKVLEALEKEEPAQLTPERALHLLDGFREDVELALHHNGVIAFRTEDDTFDPRRQRVLRTVQTDDPDTVGRLAARLRPGFEQGETVLEKERVAVYVIAPGTAAPPEGNQT